MTNAASARFERELGMVDRIIAHKTEKRPLSPKGGGALSLQRKTPMTGTADDFAVLARS
jgi:hypothetical protein